jgi:thiamine biosynthesis lipoprotein
LEVPENADLLRKHQAASPMLPPMTEAHATFPCFGSTCTVRVLGAGAQDAVQRAQHDLLGWHARFTRFEPGSELSRLNADPRPRVRVSAIMARFVEEVVAAARATGGLVDATLLRAIEDAGYRSDLRGSVPLGFALELAPPRSPARPRIGAAWHDVRVDRSTYEVQRPPGLAFDSGGVAKGLFADLLGERLARHDAFAVDCGGDLLLGGTAAIPRLVEVASPFAAQTLHSFELVAGGIATSGIGRRSWLDADGRPAHHLLDPSTGRPAFTGVVQVTALAPRAVEAELRSKAALLSGPERAAEWLPDGGVIVLDDGSSAIIEPREGIRADGHDRASAAP